MLLLVLFLLMLLITGCPWKLFLWCLFLILLASPMSRKKCVQWQKWWIWLKKSPSSCFIVPVVAYGLHAVWPTLSVSCNCFGYFPALPAHFFLLFLNSPSPSRFWSSSRPPPFLCPCRTPLSLRSAEGCMIQYNHNRKHSWLYIILISDLFYCRWTCSKMMERLFILLILKVDLLLYFNMLGPVWVNFQQGNKTDKSNDDKQPKDKL